MTNPTNHLNAGLRRLRQFPPPSWWLATLRDWGFAILATMLFFAALEITGENERHIQATAEVIRRMVK